MYSQAIMRTPLEDTIWGAHYGSCAAVRAAFDRIAPDYHAAIMSSGAPARAAACLMPHLAVDVRGIDFGCGSGAMGIALRAAGLRGSLDGIDLSPGMLELARQSGCYAVLTELNLLAPDDAARVPAGYDFAVELGLIGDYMPYYSVLPMMTATVRPGGMIGFGVEPKSTPQRPLLRVAAEQGLEILSEEVLQIPAAVLERETYHFFVARRSAAAAGR
jgi:2-polyprenyl-3-methyl-5-hydroxy-6-metoxy-1,4-benzoquinol methylase